MSLWYDRDPIIIDSATDSATTELPSTATLIDVGNASYGMGNRWVIDWERFYEILDSQHGFDMQDLGGKIDNRIRRVVRLAVREGDIS